MDFDGLSPEEKGKAVTMLLDQLPSIVSRGPFSLDGEKEIDVRSFIWIGFDEVVAGRRYVPQSVLCSLSARAYKAYIENMTDDERHSGKIRKLKVCMRSLPFHFPHAYFYGDVKDIDGGKIPESAFKLLRWVSFLRSHFLGALIEQIH